jgi:methyltransferase (TIGR00027 family)
MVAAYRARASRNPGLCNDPWAGALAGDFGADMVEEFDRLVPFMELLVAVRTAYFDAQVRFWTGATGPAHVRPLGTFAQTVDQVVLVGAGLDSRGARLSRAGLTFYEIDHPGPLQYKKERVRELQGYPHDAIAYVACDLERDDLIGALATTAFQSQRPAVFLCEGLLPYLSESAVRRIFSGIARCHESSAVLFDHVVSGTTAQAISGPQRDRLESLGEPLRFGREDALALLHEVGLPYTRSISLEDVREMLARESHPAGALRFQQVTIASRQRL